MRKNTRRYLNMRGNKYWFKRDIPAALRRHFEGRTAYLVNLETGDIKLAMRRRDEIEAELDRMFREARDGRPITRGADDIRALAESWVEELASHARDPYAWTARVLISTEN